MNFIFLADRINLFRSDLLGFLLRNIPLERPDFKFSIWVKISFISRSFAKIEKSFVKDVNFSSKISGSLIVKFSASISDFLKNKKKSINNKAWPNCHEMSAAGDSSGRFLPGTRKEHFNLAYRTSVVDEKKIKFDK